ncbi:MAG: CAP domain-containing protein [Planctomycetales bacterium]|nr:CAP domain-containing protein [Planctomycetales bacterium]
MIQRYGLAACAAIIVGGLATTAANAQFSEESNTDSPPLKSGTIRNVPKQQVDIDEAELGIVERTNKFRQQHELEAVERQTELDATAQDFADFMAKTNKYGHTADGRRPSERASAHDYEYCIVLENIAYQFRSTGFETTELAKKFTVGWENSPGHRENMLDPGVTQTGVGLARSDETGAYFAVQMFGRPKSMRIVFSVANQSDSEVSYEVLPVNHPHGEAKPQSFPLPPRLIRTHERCRPSQLVISAGDAKRTLDAAEGTRYIISAVNDSEIELTTEPLTDQSVR